MTPRAQLETNNRIFNYDSNTMNQESTQAIMTAQAEQNRFE